MAAPGRRRKRPRGSIDELPSGAFRVRVYAGFDHVTNRKHYLTDVIEPGPTAAALAEKARTRLLNQVDERRHPRTNATLAQLLERHLSMLKVAPSTMSGYRGYVERHIGPLIGDMKAGELDADVLDSFYAELRRCQDHCDGGPRVDHRTRATHQCDEHEGAPCSPPVPECRACQRLCSPHQCRPLGDSTSRQIHYLLSSAYRRAVRWRWVTVSPIDQAEPPPPRPEPQPPSVAQAAQIIKAAWRDPDWGALVWLATTTGARRGELCALQWDCVDLDRDVLTLRRSVARDDAGRWYIKDTKTHQQRRVALDPATVSVLAEQRERAEARAAALGAAIKPEGFVFSQSPDQSAFRLPGAVTQRYSKLAARLGIDTHLHALRHYSATELIAAGVDVRTVAGRLGHAGGGTTTLRVYAAWRDEADQRAAGSLGARMPARPQAAEPDLVEINPVKPHEKIAVELRDRIVDGSLPPGLPIPSMKQLALEHGVGVSTARKAVILLGEWGLVDIFAGRPTLVRRLPAQELPELDQARAARPGLAAITSGVGPRKWLDLEIRRLGRVVARLSAEADPADAIDLRRLLVDSVKRDGRSESDVGEYEMAVRGAGEQAVLRTFVATAP